MRRTHRIDRRFTLWRAIHPAMIREAIEAGAFDLRRCVRCDAWLAPDLWEQECPAGGLLQRFLSWWRW